MVKQLIYFAQNIDGVWHRGIISRGYCTGIKVIYDVDEPAIVEGIANSQQAFKLLLSITDDSMWTAVDDPRFHKFLEDKWTLATAWREIGGYLRTGDA